jgi:hypothetical protein
LPPDDRPLAARNRAATARGLPYMREKAKLVAAGKREKMRAADNFNKKSPLVAPATGATSRDKTAKQTADNSRKTGYRRGAGNLPCYLGPMPRRATYIATTGTFVVQRRTRRVVLLGHDSPLIFTRRRDAERAAAHAGGWIVRLRPGASPSIGWPWT